MNPHVESSTLTTINNAHLTVFQISQKVRKPLLWKFNSWKHNQFCTICRNFSSFAWTCLSESDVECKWCKIKSHTNMDTTFFPLQRQHFNTNDKKWKCLVKSVPKLLLIETFEDVTGVYGTEFVNVSLRLVRVDLEWQFCRTCQKSTFLQKYQVYLNCLPFGIYWDNIEMIFCDANAKIVSKHRRILPKLLQLTSLFISLQNLNRLSDLISFRIWPCQNTNVRVYGFKIVQKSVLHAFQRHVDVQSLLDFTWASLSCLLFKQFISLTMAL